MAAEGIHLSNDPVIRPLQEAAAEDVMKRDAYLAKTTLHGGIRGWGQRLLSHHMGRGALHEVEQREAKAPAEIAKKLVEIERVITANRASAPDLGRFFDSSATSPWQPPARTRVLNEHEVNYAHHKVFNFANILYQGYPGRVTVPTLLFDSSLQFEQPSGLAVAVMLQRLGFEPHMFRQNLSNQNGVVTTSASVRPSESTVVAAAEQTSGYAHAGDRILTAGYTQTGPDIRVELLANVEAEQPNHLRVVR